MHLWPLFTHNTNPNPYISTFSRLLQSARPVDKAGTAVADAAAAVVDAAAAAGRKVADVAANTVSAAQRQGESTVDKVSDAASSAADAARRAADKAYDKVAGAAKDTKVSPTVGWPCMQGQGAAGFAHCACAHAVCSFVVRQGLEVGPSSPTRPGCPLYRYALLHS